MRKILLACVALALIAGCHSTGDPGTGAPAVAPPSAQPNPAPNPAPVKPGTTTPPVPPPPPPPTSAR